MPEDKMLEELKQEEYDRQLVVDRLRRVVYQQPDPAASPALRAELVAAEKELDAAAKKRAAAQVGKKRAAAQVGEDLGGALGEETTGLEAQVLVRMAHVPTAIYHLFDRERRPLLSCEVRNATTKKRRLRVTSFIDGYSAHAVDTAEVAAHDTVTFDQLPTLFHDRVRDMTELTRATLNVLVEDLEGEVELHQTQPIWLLARTTVPLAVQDLKTGKWEDLSRYLGAFVTPNAPSVMQYLRVAADHHPAGELVGYQGNKDQVEPQVKAIFEALKSDAQIVYVNSVVGFNPEQGARSQRVRLPRESLADKEANCIDGTVLFASLLEGISMHPVIVTLPGHAFVGWETWRNSNKWHYLETTMIHSHTFEEARASAETQAESSQQLADSTGNPAYFQHLPLRTLRTEHGILPME